MGSPTPIDTAKYPPPPPETPKERTGRIVALFVMAFLMVTMMYATYMGTMHAPQPRDLPVVVAGVGADQTAAALEKSLGDTVTIEVVDVAEGTEAVATREAAGAVLLTDEGATVQTAMAGGPSRASTTQNTLLPALAGAGVTVVGTEDVAPLPEGDGTGTMVLFAAMGFMLAGYVPLSGMINGTPNLLRSRVFVPLSIGWGALMSTAIWTVLGPVMGAVDGHYPLFLGVGTLTIAAVANSMHVFTRLLGPLQVLLGMLLLVVFGVPASGLAMSLESMPGFFQALHHVLPLGQAGQALRSAIYFDAADAWPHVAVLAVGLVVSILLAALLEKRQGAAIMAAPLHQAPDAPLSALAGGPVAPYRRRLFAVAAFPAAIVVTVVTLMSFGMAKASMSDMPIAVVGPEAATAPFIAGVGEQLGDYVDLKAVTDLDEAEEMIESQEVVGAYVLALAPGTSPELVTAGGAGAAQQNAATQIFTPIAAAGLEQGFGPLETRDIAPLTEDDLGGSNSLYVGMAWIMAGFLIAAVFRGGASEIRRTRTLLPMYAGWAVGMSIWLWFLFDVLIGAVNGHVLTFLGAAAFTIFCVSWASSVLVRMFGLGTLIPVMVLIMLAGVPASGGGLSIWMVPEAFRFAADVLPLPAAVDFARSVTYFDGVGVGQNLLVIGIWGIAGLLLNFFVVDPYVNRKGAPEPAPMGPKVMPERGSKSDGDAETVPAAEGSDEEELAGAAR
ncbi:ABC transporter permease [Nocardioides jishulii]|uniref:ABC transporter permease n=1 Tax=Nocardioides jishulii TaxID=2575440 RepID=A0A4U2YNU7_9ACTN|nr:ABC transporter permease [Nocardioides jishulii]QCX27019.1 ABC transporter permease [Nocardioides jishulii]TKI61501.1 ABC transporter permease [Nocardioides jishulii]